jgi:hypothetical protein
MTNEEQKEIQDVLTEAPVGYNMPAHRSLSVWVNYYAVTPRGSRARFNRTISLSQMRGARSETATLYYLKGLHRGCDIIINDLDFR